MFSKRDWAEAIRGFVRGEQRRCGRYILKVVVPILKDPILQGKLEKVQVASKEVEDYINSKLEKNT